MENNMTSNSGGILTASEIERQVNLGNINIENFSKKRLNPNSYNIRIGSIIKTIVPNRFLSYEEIKDMCPFRDGNIEVSGMRVIDPKKPIETLDYVFGSDGVLLIPGQHYLIPTFERISTDKFITKLTGRSTSGRMSISTFQSANFGDLGFSGVWTLQVSVMIPIIIYPNSELVQAYFLVPFGDVDVLYHGKYQNSNDAVGPRYDRTIIK